MIVVAKAKTEIVVATAKMAIGGEMEMAIGDEKETNSCFE